MEQAFITIYDGMLKSGKSQAAKGDSDKSPLSLWIVPTPKNKNSLITAIPYMEGTEQNLRHLPYVLKAKKRLRLVYQKSVGTKMLFEHLAQLDGVCFVFDDFPALFTEVAERTDFEAWVALIRHQDSRVIITTQRLKGKVPIMVREITEALYFVSALNNEDEADDLYKITNTNTYGTKEEFREALKNNPQYKLFPIIQ